MSAHLIEGYIRAHWVYNSGYHALDTKPNTPGTKAYGTRCMSTLAQGLLTLRSIEVLIL
jgi:hypothetical protein